MKILTDLHTHTSFCNHAYGTIKDNADVALQRGLEMLAITEHGPKMPGAPDKGFFLNNRVIPRNVDGMTLLFGAECNIMDEYGRLDFTDKHLQKLDLIIASVHPPTLQIKSEKHYTAVLLGAISNQYVDILGHIGRSSIAFDFDTVVKAARDAGKLIEINNHTLNNETKDQKFCPQVVRACIKYDAPVVVNSDAHSPYNVGIFTEAIRLLQQENFPERLVVNRNRRAFMEYLKSRSRTIDAIEL